MKSLLGAAHLEDLSELASQAPPGNFVELGVYMGGSARLLYEIAEAQGRVLHLYDTFAGHPVVDERLDNIKIHPKGRYSEASETLEQLRLLMPNAVFHVGVFPDTLVDMSPVAFVHCDMDLYWPTLAACKLLPPMMVPGGMMLFDDYTYKESCPGVHTAVHEIFEKEISFRSATHKAVVTL